MAACCLGLLGEHALARTELRAVAEIHSRARGSVHPLTLLVRAIAAIEHARAGHEVAAIHELVGIVDSGYWSGLVRMLGRALMLIDQVADARDALAAMAGLDPATRTEAFVGAAAAAGAPSSADRGRWLGVWSSALVGDNELEGLGRLFGASSELLDDRPFVAQSMPEEERRLVYRFAGREEVASTS